MQGEDLLLWTSTFISPLPRKSRALWKWGNSQSNPFFLWRFWSYGWPSLCSLGRRWPQRERSGWPIVQLLGLWQFFLQQACSSKEVFFSSGEYIEGCWVCEGKPGSFALPLEACPPFFSRAPLMTPAPPSLECPVPRTESSHWWVLATGGVCSKSL